MFPKTGHVVNLEEPDLFNQVVGDFLARVDAGRWGAARSAVDCAETGPEPLEPRRRQAYLNEAKPSARSRRC